MFAFLKNKAINVGLSALKERIMSEYLEGIGVIKSLAWQDGQLKVALALNGLEDRPIEITAKDFEIAPDGSSVTVHAYEANMPFAQTALNRYAARAFAVPEGMARTAVLAIGKTLAV